MITSRSLRLTAHPGPQHVSDTKVRYKVLDGGVEFVEVIPKNPSGKLQVSLVRWPGFAPLLIMIVSQSDGFCEKRLRS